MVHQSPFSSSWVTIALKSFSAPSGLFSFFADGQRPQQQNARHCLSERLTLGCVVHVFEIYALLFLRVIIRVVEALLYIGEHRGKSERGGLNNIVASLHIIGIIIIHGGSKGKSCGARLVLGRTAGDCKEINGLNTCQTARHNNDKYLRCSAHGPKRCTPSDTTSFQRA